MPLGDENPSIGSTCAHRQSVYCRGIVNYEKDMAYILANVYGKLRNVVCLIYYLYILFQH